MTDPTTSAVRNTLLIDNTTSLPEAYITQAITDAKTITGQSDELALRWYTCYLIATNWSAVMDTSSIEGISFREPKPEPFLKLYNERIKKLNAASGTFTGMEKITTNPDLAYDTTYNYLRERTSGDDNF